MAVNNRATRLNRTMMFGTMFLGLIVKGTCFGFMYYAYDMQQQKNDIEAQGDSLLIEINDSALFD
jgi:hypothetical protein